jgi:hypothetical protein
VSRFDNAVLGCLYLSAALLGSHPPSSKQPPYSSSLLIFLFHYSFWKEKPARWQQRIPTTWSQRMIRQVWMVIQPCEYSRGFWWTRESDGSRSLASTSDMTDVTSINSAIKQYRRENGRTYHNYGVKEYFGPVSQAMLFSGLHMIDSARSGVSLNCIERRRGSRTPWHLPSVLVRYPGAISVLVHAISGCWSSSWKPSKIFSKLRVSWWRFPWNSDSWPFVATGPCFNMVNWFMLQLVKYKEYWIWVSISPNVRACALKDKVDFDF